MSIHGIWKDLRNGYGVEEILNEVPDEYYPWAMTIIRMLHRNFTKVSTSTWATYCAVVDGHLPSYLNRDEDPEDHREAFLRAIEEHEHQDILLGHYDDLDVSGLIWKAVKPERPDAHRPWSV